MTVTVFTKPHCPQCDATKRQLTKLGVPFETVDLTQNPSTLEQLQAAGFQQAPVVITPDNSWTGYRPDLIREVAQQVAEVAHRHAHTDPVPMPVVDRVPLCQGLLQCPDYAHHSQQAVGDAPVPKDGRQGQR